MSTENYLTYKNRPLVRSGDTLYYGFPYNPYVVIINIVSKKQVGSLDVADKVSVQLFNTDPTVRPRDKIKNSAIQFGLTQALDVATIWLSREGF